MKLISFIFLYFLLNVNAVRILSEEEKRILSKDEIKKITKGDDISIGLWQYEKGNIVKARLLWKKACSDKNMYGCVVLGNFEFVKGNIVAARELWKKACDGGLKKYACDLLKAIEGNKTKIAKIAKTYKTRCSRRRALNKIKKLDCQMDKKLSSLTLKDSTTLSIGRESFPK